MREKKYGRVIFHCQQAVEKIIKVLLYAKGFRVLRTHEVPPLLVVAVRKEELESLKKIVEMVREFELEFPRTRYPIVTKR